MKKKSILFLLALTVGIMAIGCGKKEEPASSNDTFVADEDEEEKELTMEAVMFSRTAVTNSLLSKLNPKPEKKTPIEQLEKRLNLLAH